MGGSRTLRNRRIESHESQSTVNRFSDAIPLTEEHDRTSWFRRTGRWAAGLMLGAQLLIVTPMTSGCGSDQQVQETKVGGVSDKDGNVTLQANGSSFTINFIDSKMHMPVPGIVVGLDAIDNTGFFRAYDSAGIYAATMGGVKADGSTPISGSLTEALGSGTGSNVMVSKTDSVCDVNNVWNELQNKNTGGVYLPQQIYDKIQTDPAWKAKTFEDNPDVVALSDLDNTIAQVVKTAASDKASDVTIKALLGLAIGTKNAENAVNAVDPLKWFTYLSDFCSIEEMKSWAIYYRSLCYKDDDKFTIYRLKSFLSFIGDLKLNLGPLTLNLIDTPQIIVVPNQITNPDWQISAGRIYGQIFYSDTGAWKPDNIAKATFAHPTLGTSWVDVDGSGNYSFIANSCNNVITPTYTVGALGRYDDWSQLPVATTDLTVATGNGYEIKFYVDPLTCSKYQTYYKSDPNPDVSSHHLAVACAAPDGYSGLPPGCKTIVEFDSSSPKQGAWLSIYENYLAYSNTNLSVHGISYVNIMTGENHAINPTQLNLPSLAASNVWEGKFVIEGGETGTINDLSYLIDMQQNSQTKLPVTIDGAILSGGQIFDSVNLKIYDLNGQLIDTVPPSINWNTLSFNGSKIIAAESSRIPLKMYVEGTSGIGSMAWVDLPIMGTDINSTAIIDGDNIVFDTDDKGMSTRYFEIYNISSGMQTKISGFDGDLVSPEYAFQGNTAAFIYRDTSFGPLRIGLVDITSGVLRNLLREDDAHGSSTISIYGREVAFDYQDWNNNKISMVVCNF